MTIKLDELKKNLSETFQTEHYLFSHVYGDDVLEVPKNDLIPILKHLKSTGRFDFLMDICGVDYPNREKRFDVVYHLFNSKDAARLRLKAQLAENEPVQSAIKVWRGADWFERARGRPPSPAPPDRARRRRVPARRQMPDLTL